MGKMLFVLFVALALVAMLMASDVAPLKALIGAAEFLETAINTMAEMAMIP